MKRRHLPRALRFQIHRHLPGYRDRLRERRPKGVLGGSYDKKVWVIPRVSWDNASRRKASWKGYYLDERINIHATQIFRIHTFNRGISKPCSLVIVSEQNSSVSVKFATYLRHIGANAIDDPIFCANVCTSKKSQWIRRWPRAENLASQNIRFAK